jgi:hypothetical protein
MKDISLISGTPICALDVDADGQAKITTFFIGLSFPNKVTRPVSGTTAHSRHSRFFDGRSVCAQSDICCERRIFRTVP